MHSLRQTWRGGHRYDNIGTLGGRPVGLVITNRSAYYPNQGICRKGVAQNGKKVRAVPAHR